MKTKNLRPSDENAWKKSVGDHNKNYTLTEQLFEILGSMKNSTNINTFLLGLVILFLFPLKQFLPYDIKDKVESELKKMIQVPWIMAFISILILGIYYTNDFRMLALALYIVHYLTTQ